jgi:hypothetical protein
MSPPPGEGGHPPKTSGMRRRSLFAPSHNATGKLSLFVQVVARTDPVIAVGHPQRRTLDEQDGRELPPMLDLF